MGQGGESYKGGNGEEVVKNVVAVAVDISMESQVMTKLAAMVAMAQYS
ncbi:hypothetical protein MNL09_02875 [Bartonella krasnovii]|nr:hypothetical protein MNL09_02875 [Bartonella krasnovii]